MLKAPLIHSAAYKLRPLGRSKQMPLSINPERAKRVEGLFFWFLSCLLLGCSMQQSGRKQNLTAEHEMSAQYLWDFGQVKVGEVLKHEFIFKNDSLKTLNIQEVNTSCGCTVSQVKKKTLLPGESTSVEVSFNTRGYSGPTQQLVYVNTDNLDNPIFKFIIKADVK